MEVTRSVTEPLRLDDRLTLAEGLTPDDRLAIEARTNVEVFSPLYD